MRWPEWASFLLPEQSYLRNVSIRRFSKRLAKNLATVRKTFLYPGVTSEQSLCKSKTNIFCIMWFSTIKKCQDAYYVSYLSNLFFATPLSIPQETASYPHLSTFKHNSCLPFTPLFPASPRHTSIRLRRNHTLSSHQNSNWIS